MTMTATNMTFQNTLVNSGTAVTLHGGKVTKNFKNLVTAKDAEGAYDTVPVHKGGISNPRISISGWIVINTYTSALTNVMTEALLTDFCLAKAPTKLIVTYGNEGSTVLKGRPTAGYSVGGTLTDYMWVEIESWSMNLDSQESKEGQLVHVDIQAIETHPL